MKKILRFYFRRIRRRVKRKPIGGKKYLEQKEDARKLVLERLEYWNKHYNFKYGRVSIRNQRSRWGSCSSKGNLNFNFRIITLPPHLVDYLIVHELCHLGQMNHSQRFWDLVGETLPNYLELMLELRKVRMS
jgi:predicted metal-dependent hydrolase